jgi:hypothetical protein
VREREVEERGRDKRNILFGLKSEEDEYVSEERELGNTSSDVLLSSSEDSPDPPKSDMPPVLSSSALVLYPSSVILSRVSLGHCPQCHGLDYPCYHMEEEHHHLNQPVALWYQIIII